MQQQTIETSNVQSLSAMKLRERHEDRDGAGRMKMSLKRVKMEPGRIEANNFGAALLCWPLPHSHRSLC